MTAEHEVDLVVRSWLDEGVTAMPHHVLNATLYEVSATRQRRPTDAWHAITVAHVGQWAAVAAALMIGLYALGSYIVTARPSPSPSPSASADASSPLPFQLSGGRALDPTRRYVIDQPFPARITFAVPGGWYYGGYERAEATVVRHDYTAAVWIGQPTNVYTDACHWQRGPQDPPIGPTVFDLAEALRAIPALHPSAPEPVRLGSFSGLRMTMRGGGAASGCDQDQLGVFATPASYWPMLRDSTSVAGDRRRSTLYLLDVDGSRLVIELQRDRDAGSYIDDELQQILDSMEITAH